MFKWVTYKTQNKTNAFNIGFINQLVYLKNTFNIDTLNSKLVTENALTIHPITFKFDSTSSANCYGHIFNFSYITTNVIFVTSVNLRKYVHQKTSFYSSKQVQLLLVNML